MKGLGNLSFRLVKRPKKEQVHSMAVKKSRETVLVLRLGGASTGLIENGILFTIG